MGTMTTVASIIQAISQLKDANDVNEVAQFASQRARSLASTFRVGERLQFTGPGGEVIEGTVKSVNQKTITLVNCSGRRYPYGVRVPPELLRRAEM